MVQPYKDAVGLCKTILRNGYEAYVINARLQRALQSDGKEREVDLATDMPAEELLKLFPQAGPGSEQGVAAVLNEGGAHYRFYHLDALEGAHPEAAVITITPRMMRRLEDNHEDIPVSLACPYIPSAQDLYDGFADMGEGMVRLAGNPDETLKRNYLLGVRALRFAANYALPVEANTWITVVRSSQRILDYVSVSDIMDEWRKVEAENMWRFMELLNETQLLHGLIPEVAALSRIKQIRNESGETETVLAHTIEVMRRYPEELPYDWFGTFACLLHDVGKLFTAEFFDDKWHFHQHHRVGEKVSRKILGRLRMLPADIDLVCHLVRHHMRFHTMLTDRGVRRFKALDEYPRLIELARADIKARATTYTDFNHNLKMLERADTPEEMLEPLLNGNEIMEFTELKPGPAIGMIRDALLQAQIAGEVTSVPEAVDFVMRQREKY